MIFQLSILVSNRLLCHALFVVGADDINHGLTRAALSNVRVDSGFAERKRGMYVLVCGSKERI